MFSIAYLVYAKKGATCKRKPLPTDNKNNMSDVLNSYFLHSLLAFCIGHNIER